MMTISTNTEKFMQGLSIFGLLIILLPFIYLDTLALYGDWNLLTNAISIIFILTLVLLPFKYPKLYYSLRENISMFSGIKVWPILIFIGSIMLLFIDEKAFLDKSTDLSLIGRKGLESWNLLRIGFGVYAGVQMLVVK